MTNEPHSLLLFVFDDPDNLVGEYGYAAPSVMTHDGRKALVLVKDAGTEYVLGGVDCLHRALVDAMPTSWRRRPSSTESYVDAVCNGAPSATDPALRLGMYEWLDYGRPEMIKPGRWAGMIYVVEEDGR